MMTDSPAPRDVPLCVDLDGTLVQTDMLHEALLLLARRRSLSPLQLPLWLAKGKAEFKRRIAERVSPDASTFPYHADVLALIESARGIRDRQSLAVFGCMGAMFLLAGRGFHPW